MKLVVDSNVLFTWFWEQSVFRKLIKAGLPELVAPSFALVELKKYEKHIRAKTKLSASAFEAMLGLLRDNVRFVEREQYENERKRAEQHCPDTKDVEFFAVALRFQCPLWSNDAELKKQNMCKVLNTEELIEILFG